MERTLTSELKAQIGREVKLQGWVDTKRDHGKLTFIDLRDRHGLVQIVAAGMMGELTVESVVEVAGVVKAREANTINNDTENGSIEIEVKSYRELNKAGTLPLPIKTDGYEINEETRLKYRYVDMRRPRMQKIFKMRSKFIRNLRERLFDQDFVEVETPMLTKSTKEGARDFVVPSRLQPGKFYALPQSPQQYKQLLMTAGLERYFQVAKCIRDEDLRADRGFEFTQFDIEMSFVNREDVMQTVEDLVLTSVKSVGGVVQAEKFPVFTYQEAISKYGADKFDLRTAEEKEKGVLAFAWVINFPFFKKVDKSDIAETRDGKSGWTFTHNPFSKPVDEHEQWHLNGEHVEEIITTQYDLVCNGFEVGGGSIRAHRPEALISTFKIMGYSDAEIQEGVGHMLDAFKSGTPPHGGIALGVDRLVMLLANEKSLKETIAFPMTSSGRTAVMDAPASITEEQLKELGIKTTVGKVTNGQEMVKAIKQLLDSRNKQYQHSVHQETPTSEDAARVRGTKLSEGVKALILVGKSSGKNVMLCVPGDKKANIKALAEVVGENLEMEKPENIQSKFGLQIGGVPPFGNLIGMPVYFDRGILSEPQSGFNCGLRTESITMSSKDLAEVTEAQLGDFAIT